MIGYIEVGLPGPFGESRRGGRTHGPGKRCDEATS